MAPFAFSLYNENAKGAIYPTPVVGMVGLIQDTDHITTQGFKNEGDVIVLLGETKAELGGSEFQKVMHGVVEGRPPHLDLETEKRLHAGVLAAIREGLIASAHDLSEGGLAAAVAESSISGGLGADVNFLTELRADHALFSESQSRILLSCRPEKQGALIALLQEKNVQAEVIGTVTGTNVKVDINGKPAVQASISELRQVWKDAIPCLMQ